MNIQIYVSTRNPDVLKAERFFKERRIPCQLMDLKKHRLGKKELEVFAAAAGAKALVDRSGRERVVVECPDFPYLGLWTADKPFDTGYFCIEPWSALPDAVFVGRGLEDKAGIRRLEPGGVHVLTYTTTFQ